MRKLSQAISAKFMAMYPIQKTVEHLRRRHRIDEYKRSERRFLEIGCGADRVDGFETMNIVHSKNVDYVWDASKPLPFENGTFDIIFSSHMFEHIPWYKSQTVLADWVSKLKPGGRLELWVPDGLKICKAFVDAELENNNYIDEDGWYKFNEQRDPCVWASGRIFTYGDGQGALSDPNWHRALFSERYLDKIMREANLVNVRRLREDEVRGYDHGWINLGMTGERHF